MYFYFVDQCTIFVRIGDACLLVRTMRFNIVIFINKQKKAATPVGIYPIDVLSFMR